MAVLDDGTKQELYRFFAIAFNAAPGVTYMNQLADAVTTGNMSVKQIVNVFVAKTEFTSSYPSFYTPTQFANKLVETVVGTSATDTAKAQAKADIVAALNSGMSRGDVVYQIFTNLNAKGTSDAEWGTTTKLMNNKVAVAQYYTEDLLTDSTSLTTLRSVISTVTPTTDVSSSTAIQSVLDVAVPAEAQSFTLTTSSDVKTLGAGADTFFGSLTTAGTTDTLTAGDNLNGAGGVDTLSISANGTGAISSANPTLTNIEKVLVSNAVTGTGITGVTIDMSLADSNVTNIGTTASSTATDVTLFKNVGKIAAAEMRGVGDLTVTYVTSVTNGTGDSQTLTLNGVGTSATGMSTFDVNGIETLNIVSSNSSNYLALGGSADDATKVNISGSQALTLDLSSATGSAATTIDASAATAAVTLTHIKVGAITVSGGAGNDSFNFTTGFDATTNSGTTKYDSINGGAGNDTLIIDQGVGTGADTLFSQVSNVEFLTLNGTGAGEIQLGAKALAAGINTVTLSGTGNSKLNIGTGFSGSLTVNLSTGADNTVSNANGSGVTNLTVKAAANAITTSDVLTGATGAAYTDIISLSANGSDGTGTGYVGAVFGSNFTNFDQITITANTTTASLGAEITLDAANVASGKTLTIDASALTNTSAALYLDGSSGVAGSKLSVTGGAGNDTIILGAGNDVVIGSDGNETITAGAGNDNLSGGNGNDVFDFGDTNLGTGDTVNGGDGTDTIIVGTGAITSAMFTNVTNVENLQFSGNATLTGNIPFTSFDLSAATGAGTLTLSSGYTNATTVTLGSGDTVDNSGANVALTVNVTVADYGTGTGLVVTGGTGIDTLNLTASTGTDGVTLNASSSINVINVVDGTGAGSDVSITLGSGYSVSVTLDASSLDAGTNTSSGTANSDWENLTFNATNIASTKTVNVTGGAGHDAITGGAGNDTIVGGDGNDTITAGAGYDRLTGGNGNDKFVMAENLSGDDVIAGGDGNDTITVGTGAITDLAFLQITSVETIALTGSGGGSLTLDTRAQTAGIATVTADSSGTNTTTVNAAGFTNALTINVAAATATGAGNFNLVGGAGNDTFIFAGSGVLSSADTVTGGAGTDVLQLNNSTGNVEFTLGSGISGIESFLVNDASTGSAGVSITLHASFGKSTQSTFNLDASSLDSGESLTFLSSSTGNVATSGTGYLAVTVKGGAGDDSITGHYKGVDTIDLSVGGADTVVISTIQGITAVDQITGFVGGTGTNGDKLDLFGDGASTTIGTGSTGATDALFGWDSDGSSSGGLTAAAFDTRTASVDVSLGDGTGSGYSSYVGAAKTDVVMVVNGATTLDVTKVVATSTALKGEFIVNDGTDAYILQAAETTSTSFNIYHVYDSDSSSSVAPEVELVGQVTLASGTFADLKPGNIA